MTPDKRTGLPYIVHLALLGGVVLSAALLTLGIASAFLAGDARSEGPPPALAETFRGAFYGNARDVLDMGLIVLMATPILRVVILSIGWALDRKHTFAAIAAVVLVLLGVSFWVGVG